MAMTEKQLLAHADKCMENWKETGSLEKDCDMIVYLLDNCEIIVPEENRFFVNVDLLCANRLLLDRRIDECLEIYGRYQWEDGVEAMAYSGGLDFGHTTAQWERVIPLGIYGLRQELDVYAAKYATDEKKKRFYANVTRAYDAALRFLKRGAQAAQAKGKPEMAKGLFHLSECPPSNLFEAMQTSIIYYVLQHLFEQTSLRTLGRLDRLYFPYYEKETREQTKALLADFMKEIDRLDAIANIPFVLGGSDLAGKDQFNDLSMLILEAYTTSENNNTKLHLLVTDHTPEEILRCAFDGARRGNNSMVFLSDKKVIESLEQLGEDREDAVDYHVVGCYECGGRNEVTDSCNARVNIQKAVEYALNGGVDAVTGKQIGLVNDGCFPTYEEFFAEVKRQLTHLSKRAMESTDFYEKEFNRTHSAPFLSGTYTSALEAGGDLYCDHSAKYCNSSVNGVGLGTAVDSLAAIRKLVYEDRTLTLEELKQILASDWEGQEILRQTVKQRFPKFGTGDPKTDAIARELVDQLAKDISRKPNTKGGQYRLGLFSIDWRWEMGAMTGASAGGRKKGETLSQNTSATFGADKLGATAHFLSVAAVDTTQTPNGAMADIDLHRSSVQGENGLNALIGALKTYFAMGGFGVHYNIMDTAVLEEAKANPEKYPNLQVRLCGWNVLFSSLSEKEKDEFIARSSR